MKRNYYTLVGIALIALPAWGQQKTQPQLNDTTVSRTVIVEQEYTPDIMDASKINVLPPVVEPKVSKKEVEYATTPAPSNAIPTNQMQIYMGKEVQPSTLPGYARLGYGNYGNLDLLGNYLFKISGKDKLNVNYQMDGMDGKLDNLPYHLEATKWDAFYYRTRANVDYTHQFNKLDLNVAADFGLSNFNFKPESINNKQKFTSGSMQFGVTSTDESLPIHFTASTGLLLYQRQHNTIFSASPKESQVLTQANVSGSISDEQRIHVALTMNNLIYKQIDFNNYTALNLNPYYELKNDSWQLHLGAQVDLSFGHGKGLRMSPDVTAQYTFSDSYVIYAKATGGKKINDFRRLEMLNPYGEFAIFDNEDAHPTSSKQLKDTYEQLNATLGFKASPYPGVWFNLYGGYQNLKEMVYNQIANPISLSPFIAFEQTHGHNTYVGADVTYDYKQIVTLSATAKYYDWSANEVIALYIQPTTEFAFSAIVRPIPALSIDAGYLYVGRKKVEAYGKMAPVSNLHIGANYNLFKGISAYVRVNNLLNKKYQYYMNYATEGLNFLGGLSFQF